ncbi:unnamed protein product [Closterium sp. Yama58-4]|nr:unnamed protein product [Closterium sp. Yama58-4]
MATVAGTGGMCDCQCEQRILHTGVSEFQDIELLESGPFGKVLVLDGKLQSAEADEFVYHESLVHPALLYHPQPKRVFIMGGGEGSTARECLKHSSVEMLEMCDIDKEVVEFCRRHLTINRDTFASPRLKLIINDALEELRSRTGEEGYDVIIGDLADPVDGGPCYKLYTESFYTTLLKPRLNPGGILVTQAGPAGILSAREVYTPIYNTLRQVFKYVVPYAAHVPSYADTWGWIMASDTPFPEMAAADVDARIQQRVDGELRFLDGSTMLAVASLNKHLRNQCAMETTVYTEDSPLFIHGYLGCFCPCVLFGQNVQRLHGRQCFGPCVMHCLLGGCIVWAAYSTLGPAAFWCTPISCYACNYRSELRAKYHLKAEPAGDCPTHFLCHPCALCQEHRELQARPKPSGLDFYGGRSGEIVELTAPSPVGKMESVFS